MRKTETKARIGNLMVLLLFAVFAVCILSVLLTGADIYEHLVDRGTSSYDRRTSAQYLATRVRQADQLGGVSVREFGGEQALVLTESIDGAAYETLIYYSDGAIRELFIEAGTEFFPEDGTEVMEAGGLRVIADGPSGRKLRVSVQTADGVWENVVLYLRSGEVFPS